MQQPVDAFKPEELTKPKIGLGTGRIHEKYYLRPYFSAIHIIMKSDRTHVFCCHRLQLIRHKTLLADMDCRIPDVLCMAIGLFQNFPTSSITKLFKYLMFIGPCIIMIAEE